ncbi:hypothetical protein L602_001600000710 [Cupriavidus gilardii J11]|uniref:Uncharacterized protein n=1 Tax=Cupriavidus gilardii J11 TaxID=936133 RepID=A0A562BRT8_9BURK|nr:hypothetical protein [Cupriavidus gilardii]TWG87590.1 hypothetical protein L602_001600000710 [Cupriavidus gilardii J11]
MHDAGSSSRPGAAIAGRSHTGYGTLPSPPPRQGRDAHAAPGANFNARCHAGGPSHSHRIDVADPGPAPDVTAPAGNGFCERHRVLGALLCPLLFFGTPTMVGIGLLVAGHARDDFDMQLGGGLTAFICGGTGLIAGGLGMWNLFDRVSAQEKAKWLAERFGASPERLLDPGSTGHMQHRGFDRPFLAP